MNITELGLNKTILVRLTFILIVILGIYSYMEMPKYLDPDLNFNQVFITTIHKNLAPEDVEKFITVPIEKEIKDISGIKRIFSTSSANRSLVIIEFEDEIEDMNSIVQDLRNEVDKIEDFPDDTEKSVIDDLDTSFLPICLVAVGGELATDRLLETAEDIAEDLEDLQGISKVVQLGKRERRIFINVDPGKLESYGLTLNDVVREIRGRNRNTTAGHIDIGEHKIRIRLMGKYTNVEDFNGLVFVNKVSGGVIFLKDFASIETGHEDPKTLAKLNGKSAIVLQVKRKKNSNVIKIIDEIKTLLDKYKLTSSLNLELTIFNDTSLEIKDRIHVLQKNAGLGMALVFASLALFLGRRQAVFAFVGIPICFFIAFILMKVFDLSINGISLFALVLVLGMIVDDAIIVLENVYRYLEKGMAKREAILAGVREVKWPIISAVLTSMAAFAPLLLVSGIMGKFISAIPKVIIFALSASLLEVLFMMPSHLMEFSKISPSRNRADKKKKKSFNFRISPMAISKKIYFKILKFSIRYRYPVFVIFVAAFIASLSAIPKIGVQLFPPSDAFPRFDIKIWLPVGTKLHTTLEKLEEIHPVLYETFGDNIDSLISAAGFVEVEYKGTFAEHVGTINVVLKSAREGKKSTEELIALSRQLLKETNGIEEFKVDRLKEGPPTGSPVELRIMGENWDMLEEFSVLVKEELKKINGTVDIRSDYKKNMKEIQIRLKEIEAKKYSITQEALSTTVMTAFQGMKATVYHEESEEIDVYVRLEEKYREDFNSILDLNVAAADGRLIPLKEVAFMEIKPVLFQYNHFGRERTITVTSEIENKITTSSEVNNKLKTVIDKKILPQFPEVSVQYGGEFEETRKSVREVLLSFSLALFLIFLILATQFNSFIQPLIVMLAIPFGAIGVVMGLLVSGNYFTFPAMIGIVGLAGVIVNDSIVLITFANNLMGDSKVKPRRSIMKASLVRFRPIILTTITTVFGMLPMALGLGGKSPLWAPLATAFVWGISFSTTLILILVPCVFLIIEDIKNLSLRRILKKPKEINNPAASHGA